jgi:phospholipid-translocating ATPase
MALCHNVTPIEATKGESSVKMADDASRGSDHVNQITYKASSPDEIALVKFTESVGLTLYQRSLSTITLLSPKKELLYYDILYLFPFSSELKRMSIIVRERQTNRLVFYVKGADSVMISMVQYSDWIEEECGNMARIGLRTLVFGKRILSEEEFASFQNRYKGMPLFRFNKGGKWFLHPLEISRDFFPFSCFFFNYIIRCSISHRQSRFASS